MNQHAEATMASRPPRWLLVVGALALVVRLIYFFQFSGTPFARVLFLDSEYYDKWAAKIAAGDWLAGDRPWFFEPGFAYFLAILKLLGGGTSAARLMQALFGTATAVLTALLGRRLAGDRAGFIAGILAALYLPCIYYEGLLLKTTAEVFLGMLLLVLLLEALDKPRPAIWLGLGALSGIAALVKGNYLIVVPAFVLWAWWALRRRGHPRPYLLPLTLLAGFALLIACTTIRNYAVSGEFVALVYEGGYNFYIGNGPEADGVKLAPSFVRAASKYEELDSNAEAIRRAGRELKYTEISSFWWDESKKCIREQSGRWLRLLGNKFLLFWHRYEASDNVSMYFVRDWVPLLRWPLPGWWLAAPLGLAGLVVAFRKRDEAWTLVAFYVLLLMIALILFKVVDRYRLAVATPMLALGVAALAEGLRAKRTTGLIVVVALLVGIVLVDVLPNPVLPKGQNFANHHEMLGVAYADQKDADAAITEFQRAIQIDPNLKTAHYNLARALHTLKKDDAAAEEAVRRALRLEPNYGGSLFLLGEILMNRNRPAEAADAFLQAAASGYEQGDAYISAAAALGRIERYTDAAAVLEKGLKLKPDDSNGLELLGNLRYLKNDIPGALEAWERSLKLRPENAKLRQNIETIRAEWKR